MATIRFPFHHAVQHETGAEDRIVYSGDLIAGYAEQNNYESIDQSSKHYWFDLYYEIPADTYKYTIDNGLIPYEYIKPKFDYIDKSAWYSKIVFKSGVVYYDKTSNDPREFNHEFPWSNKSRIFCHLVPGDGYTLTQPFCLNEPAFNNMQEKEPIYLDSIMPMFGYGYGTETYEFEDYTVYYKFVSLETFKNVEESYLNLEAKPALTILTPTYPVDIYARKDRDLTVAWEETNNINRDSELFYVVSSEITITDSDGDSISASIVGTDNYHIFDTTELEDLSIGKCTVDIECLDNYGYTTTTSFEFDLIGESDAPEITNVTQNSMPTVTWTSEGQITWEMQISNASGIVYKSGVMIGSETTFQVPKFLEDGDYTIELRYNNLYGVTTQWGSYFLQLAPTKPDAPEGVIVSARTDFGVSVSCSDMETTGKLLVVRRKDENSTPVILGEYNGTFVDYLIGLNDYNQYTIRNYVEGYADGEWIDGVVLAKGEVIRDSADYSKFIHIWKSEDNVSNYEISEDKSDVLMQCVGRVYPVAEFGEWITSRRRFGGYVSDTDFKKLLNMKLKSNHVLLQANEEYMPCYMEFSDNGQYIDGGKFVSFNMTRIDGEK